MAKRKRFKDHAQSLFDELATALRTGDHSKAQVKIELLHRKMLSPAPAGEQTHRQPLPIHVDKDEEKTVGKQTQSRETPAGSIRALKAVWKMLVESSAIQRGVNGKYVQSCLDKPEDFTLHECEVVARLVNAVRPYVPKRAANGKYPHSPALCAPLVLLADSVLRATGNHGKTREWIPDVKGSSLHSLHITPSVMFQLLCSSRADQFDVHDSTGRIMDGRTNLALDHNKKRLFESFFQLDKIEHMCSQHGIKFRYAFQYDSNLAIHLEGDVLPHGPERSGHPSRDHVLDRKRSKEKKKAVETGTNWSQELERLGMTKAEVSHEFQRCREAMAKTEGEFKEATKILERLEETRTLCRLIHKNAERDTKVDAYAKLKEARLEVALHRDENAALEKRYFELKEQVWIWSRLSKAKHPVDDKEGDNTAKKVSGQKRTAIDRSSSSHAGPSSSSSSSSTAEPASRSTKRRKRTKQQDVKSEHALEPDPVVQSFEAAATAPTRRSVKRDATLPGKRAAPSSPDPSRGSLPMLKTVDNS
ncbi:hypothetical protein BGZ72_002314, partial [Mortierella alpina]